MYEDFYGLRERPFDLTPDPRFLFLSPQHHEALTHLQYALSGRPGITLVVGDAGTGKSTLIRATMQSSRSEGSRVATLANPTLTRAEFYDHLAQAFGFSRDAARSKTVFLRELTAALDESQQRGGVVALIVDEAQSLPTELLEELRLLTNAEGAGERSLTLVLVGQPELAERLNDPSLRQLKQRVALRAELERFTLKDTARYIASRITMAGGRADQIFTREAVMAIHQGSNGLPRIISVLCDNALVTGFASNVKPVGSAVVAGVCADFDLRRVAVTVTETVKEIEAPGPLTPPSLPLSTVEPDGDGVTAPQDSQPDAAHADRNMFGDYTGPKRFSFFRGGQR